MPDTYPLPESDPQSLGFAAKPLEHLDQSAHVGHVQSDGRLFQNE